MGNTEGYVIAKLSFGHMGILLVAGGTGFNSSILAKSALIRVVEVGFEEGIKGLVQERLSLK